MIRKRGFAVIGAAVALLFALSLPGWAQEGQGQPGAAEAEEVSNQELEQAVKAYAEITQVREKFQQELQSAEGQDEVQDLQTEANEEMTQAVEEQGLDVQGYNRIIEAVKMDEELREDFMSKLENIQ
ncbi:MAG: DUF4168 domain-containing protein [Desulfobacteraceae bacterium]